MRLSEAQNFVRARQNVISSVDRKISQMQALRCGGVCENVVLKHATVASCDLEKDQCRTCLCHMEALQPRLALSIFPGHFKKFSLLAASLGIYTGAMMINLVTQLEHGLCLASQGS